MLADSGSLYMGTVFNGDAMMIKADLVRLVFTTMADVI